MCVCAICHASINRETDRKESNNFVQVPVFCFGRNMWSTSLLDLGRSTRTRIRPKQPRKSTYAGIVTVLVGKNGRLGCFREVILNTTSLG